MGFYNDMILPRLCHLVMRNRRLALYRERVITDEIQLQHLIQFPQRMIATHGRPRADALISTAAILVAFQGFSNECSGKACVGASYVVVTGNPSEREIIRSTR